MSSITPLSNAECASFCSQMAMILKSGISSTEGVSIMQNNAKSEEEKKLLDAIYETLIQTGSLFISLEETKAFPAHLLSMVQIGEQTGRMDDVMGSLETYYEKEDGLVTTIRNAITYPCIMMFMMLAVILILITKVMPVFGQVFRQLGTEMTGISLLILNVGNFFSKHSIALIVFVVLVIAGAVALVRTKKGQGLLAALASRLGGSHSLSEQIAAYRFANGMALTLSSGLTPEECLKLSFGLLDEGTPFAEKVKECQEKVSQGADLYDTLLSCGIFSGVYVQIASIAAHTGRMDEMMSKIAARYEAQIDERIAQILGAVEPTLVIILSIIVGIILLSVMLPLMGIMSAL